MSGRGEQEQEEEEELGLLSQRINTERGREVSRIMCSHDEKTRTGSREPVFLIFRPNPPCHEQMSDGIYEKTRSEPCPTLYHSLLQSGNQMQGAFAILHVVMCNS